MKKVLLSLLAVAALVLSCQNYDDEFDALNAKVASLESQISSLADLRTAVTSVQSSVSALQAAVSGLDYSSDIAAILDDLGELATAIDRATTSADLDALKGELNTSLDALKALIEANSSSIASLVATNADLKSELEALGIDVDAVLAQNSTYTGNINITNAAELAFAKSLGDKVKIINGNVKITIGYTNDLTAADVAPVSKLIEQVVGNVTLSMDHEPIDLSALVNVSGDYLVEGWDPTDDNLANVGDMYLEYRFPYSYPNLLTAKKIILSDLGKSDGTTKSTTAVTEPIGAQPGVTSVSFLALTSATSISTGSADPHTSGASTHSSGGNINLTAGGTAGVLSLLNAETVKIGDVAVTSLKVNKATAVELHFDGTAAGIAVEDTNAGTTADPEVLASVIVKAKASSAAITIDMLKTGTFSAPDLADAQSTFTSDALVNTLPALVYADGLTFTESKTIDLPKLAIVGDVASGVVTSKNLSAVKVEGLVSLPALTNVDDLTLTKATSLTAAKADIEGTLLLDVSEDDTTVSVANVNTFGTSVLVGIENLTLSAQSDAITFGGSTEYALESLDVSGKTQASPISLSINSTTLFKSLESVKVGGQLDAVVISTAGTDATEDNTKLTTVTTSGTIRSFEVSDNYDLVTLTMNHTEDTTHGTAPIIRVKNNLHLKDFSTAVGIISELEITGNVQLASFDASSIDALPANYSSASVIKITVTGNYLSPANRADVGGTSVTTSTTVANVANWYGMTGSYQKVTSTATRAYKQDALNTLKPLFDLVNAQYNNSVVADRVRQSAADLVVAFDYKVDNTPVGGTTAQTTINVATGVTTNGIETLTALTVETVLKEAVKISAE